MNNSAYSTHPIRRNSRVYHLLCNPYGLPLHCIIYLCFFLTFVTPATNVNPDFMWAGGVTERSASLRVGFDHNPIFAGDERLHFVVSTNEELLLDNSHVLDQLLGQNEYGFDTVWSFELHDLRFNWTYFYGVVVHNLDTGEVDASKSDIGSFRTFDHPKLSRKFSFAMSSCMQTGSDTEVFSKIMENQADVRFFLEVGDFHYGNIDENKQERFDNAYKNLLSQTRSQRFFRRNMPMVYVWDDHDFCGENSNKVQKCGEAAGKSYRKNFPHYPLPSNDSTPIYQSFSYGNVLFIVSDLRSEAEYGKRIWSAEQEIWFFNKLVEGRDNYEIIMWVSTRIWIGTFSDGWSRWPKDREKVADFIAQNNITSIILLSGDSHSIASDNGENSDYSDKGEAGFPVLHAGPLDKYGNTKGGPYSNGCFAYLWAYNSQYVIVTVEELVPNTPLCFGFKGYAKAEGEEFLVDPIMTHQQCSPFVRDSNAGDASCQIHVMPARMWVVFIFGLAFSIGDIVMMAQDWRRQKLPNKEIFLFVSLLLACFLTCIAIRFEASFGVACIVYLFEAIIIMILLWLRARWRKKHGFIQSTYGGNDMAEQEIAEMAFSQKSMRQIADDGDSQMIREDSLQKRTATHTHSRRDSLSDSGSRRSGSEPGPMSHRSQQNQFLRKDSLSSLRKDSLSSISDSRR